eukprot:m51a1_g3414 hypothetical protein (133) ;mRNA; f:575994-576392
MSQLPEELAGVKNWVVVGASEDPSKFGNRILRELQAHRYNVRGVNPKGGSVDGTPFLRSLAEVPESERAQCVVDVVVPPRVAEGVVREAKSLGFRAAWLQPGSESDAAVEWAEHNSIDVVHHDCIMHHMRQW